MPAWAASRSRDAQDDLPHADRRARPAARGAEGRRPVDCAVRRSAAVRAAGSAQGEAVGAGRQDPGRAQGAGRHRRGLSRRAAPGGWAKRLATQKPSSPKPPGKTTSQSAGKPPAKARASRRASRTASPRPRRRRRSGKPERKASRGGRFPPPAKSRPRDPRPAAPQAPREGRLVAGHEEDLLYGRHAVAEALRAGRRHIRRIFLAQGMDRTGILSEIVSAARLVGCPVVEVPRERLDDAVGGNHQGVIAQAAAVPRTSTWTELLSRARRPALSWRSTTCRMCRTSARCCGPPRRWA